MKRIVLLLVLFIMGIGSLQAQFWSRETDPQTVVDESLQVLRDMTRHPDYETLNEELRSARGVLVFPSVYRGGFFIGGSGGLGVMMAWSESRQDYSPVAFYSLGSISFGLQFGGDRAEVVMVVRTQDAIDSLFGSAFRLGGDASVAAGPVGAGRSATANADVLTFARSQGAFIGISLEGSQLRVRDDFNQSYYGRELRPVDIIEKREVDASGSLVIRQFLQSARGTASSRASAPVPEAARPEAPASEPAPEPGSGGLTFDEIDAEAI